jgi:aldose 1-epimerase
VKGKQGVFYRRFGGVCFEAGNYPTAVNEQGFPSAVLKKENVYRQLTSYRFSAEN